MVIQSDWLKDCNKNHKKVLIVVEVVDRLDHTKKLDYKGKICFFVIGSEIYFHLVVSLSFKRLVVKFTII